MSKRDLNHVIFGAVPKSSYAYIRSNVPNKDKKLEYYKNLMQVTIRSAAMIYDLDSEGYVEVGFL